MDHLHAVNQLMKKCAEYKIPLVVALVDYNNVFDSVQIQDAIEALKEQEVDEVYIEVLKHIYRHTKSFISCTKIQHPSSSRKLSDKVIQVRQSCSRLVLKRYFVT